MKYSEIKKLEDELKKIKEQQNKCHHMWGEVKADKEAFEDEKIERWSGTGDDIVPIYKPFTNYRNGWSRECEKCGKYEFTTEKKPTVIEERPYFGK